jgi:hypothetical protein
MPATPVACSKITPLFIHHTTLPGTCRLAYKVGHSRGYSFNVVVTPVDYEKGKRGAAIGESILFQLAE